MMGGSIARLVVALAVTMLLAVAAMTESKASMERTTYHVRRNSDSATNKFGFWDNRQRKLGDEEQQDEGDEPENDEGASNEKESPDQEQAEEQNNMQQQYQNQYYQQQMAQNDYNQDKQEVEQQYYQEGQEEDDENPEQGDLDDAGFINNFLFRVDGDLYNMWNSSPSQWVTEYWEVLAVFGALFFLVGVLLCYVCCIVPCCSPYESNDSRGHAEIGDPHAGGRAVATESEMEKHLQNKKRRFFGRNKRSKAASDGDTVTDTEDYEAPFIRMDDVNEAPSQEADMSPAFTAGATTPMSDASTTPEECDTVPQNNSSYTEGAMSPRSATSAVPQSPRKKDGSNRMSSTRRKSRRSKYGFKEGSSLWEETVDVWSEFLGFKNTTYSVPGADSTDLLSKSDTMASASEREEDPAAILTDAEDNFDPNNVDRTSGKPPLSPRKVGPPVPSQASIAAPSVGASASEVALTTADSAKEDGQRQGEVRSSKSKDKSSRSSRTSDSSKNSKSLRKKAASSLRPEKDENRGEEV
jgi:hypothetical protein